jgi:hypothetical protein
MIVLIYGMHRVSEPWAYDVARDVISRNDSVIGVECPAHISERTDYVPVFNKYVEKLRKGVVKRPAVLWEGLSDFHSENFRPVYEWERQVEHKFMGRQIFDLHGGFNSSDCGCNIYSPSVLAKMQFGRVWTDNSQWIESLASEHKLYAENGLAIGEKTIEIILPPDIPKHFGVNEDYIPELEEVVNQGYRCPVSKGGIKISSLRSWKGEFTPPTFWQAGSLLIPDKSSPRYNMIRNAAANFLDDFFRKIDDLDH